MTAKEFVELFYIEKSELINQYFGHEQTTEVGLNLAQLGLNSEQMKKIKSIIDTALTDTIYTVLLGLDGEASIGNVQQNYKLYDESGNKLTGHGEIEQYAYEYFHEVKKESE